MYSVRCSRQISANNLFPGRVTCALPRPNMTSFGDGTKFSGKSFAFDVKLSADVERFMDRFWGGNMIKFLFVCLFVFFEGFARL